MIKKGGNKGSLRNRRCLYNIGYGTHEESESTQMLHKRKFSKSELRDIVAKATIEAAKEYFESEFGSDEHLSFQQIYDSVIKQMKKMGFKEAKFEAEFSIFGWPNLLDEKDWEGQRDENLDFLTKKLKGDKKLKTIMILRKL